MLPATPGKAPPPPRAATQVASPSVWQPAPPPTPAQLNQGLEILIADLEARLVQQQQQLEKERAQHRQALRRERPGWNSSDFEIERRIWQFVGQKPGDAPGHGFEWQMTGLRICKDWVCTHWQRKATTSAAAAATPTPAPAIAATAPAAAAEAEAAIPETGAAQPEEATITAAEKATGPQ